MKIISALKRLNRLDLIVAISSSFLNKTALLRREASGTTEAEAQGDIILVYDKFFRCKLTMQKYILLHELGHVFQNMNDISILDLMDKNFAVFEYKFSGNAMEGFAEAFAVYLDSPNELKKRYLEQFKIMKNWVGNGAVYKKWVGKALKILKDLPYGQLERIK